MSDTDSRGSSVPSSASIGEWGCKMEVKDSEESLSTSEGPGGSGSQGQGEEGDSLGDGQREMIQIVTNRPLVWLCSYKDIKENGRRHDSRNGYVPDQICPKPYYKTILTQKKEKVKLKGGNDWKMVWTTPARSGQLVSSPHCQIVNDRVGGYWIKDLDSKHGTFVNGNKVLSGCKVRIKHHDVISLGEAIVSVDDAKKRKDPVCVYEFQETYEKIRKKHLSRSSRLRQATPSDGSEVVESSCDTPELNENVIHSICEYLPSEDLKSLRLVNRMWNRGATNIFRHRSKIRLTLSFQREDGLRNSIFFEDMKTFDAPNVLLVQNANQGRKKKKSESKVSVSPRIYEGNLWLCTTFLKNVRCLQYSVNLKFHWEIRFVCQVLENFAQTLRELDFCLNIRRNLKKDDCSLLGMLQLQNRLLSLRRFKVNFNGIEYNESSKPYLPLIPQMLGLMPNLESLNLSPLDGYISHQKIVEEILTLAPTLLPKLTELMLPLTSGNQHRNSLESELFLHFVLKFPLLLKTLEIALLPMCETNVTQVQELLERNASTLQNLKLSLCQNVYQDESVYKLRLPTLPELRTLELHLQFTPCPGGQGFTFKLEGPEVRPIQYSRDMPLLNKLAIEVALNDSEDSDDDDDEDERYCKNALPPGWPQLFQFFFPQNKQICTSLKELNLPEPPTRLYDNCSFKDCDYCLEKTWGSSENHYHIRTYSRLSRLFPNANNNFMQAVRRFV